MEWLSSLSSLSSLWDGDEPATREREMDEYTYEPISEIVSNEIELRSKDDQKMGVISYLYFGLDEGKPYLKVVHNNSNNRELINEERFMITSCYAESGRGAWFVEYQCENRLNFVFTRVFTTIEMVVKKNGYRRKCYEIDVKYNKDKEKRFRLFNKKDVKSDMWDDLRDLYKFEELFEHAY